MFKVGQKVRVKKNGDGDSNAVAGKTGVVAAANGEFPTIYFKGWTGGHNGDGSQGDDSTSFWGVAVRNLTAVKKAKKVKRSKKTKRARS